MRKYTVNNRIRVDEVRVIDKHGKNIGVLPTNEARNLAKEDGLDLVVVSEKANPPVCKILDFKRFLFEERQKHSKGRTKKSNLLKEFRISPTTGKADIDLRVKRARKFITEDKSKIKLTVRFKGRQIVHPEIGKEKLNEMIKTLGDISEPAGPMEKKGRMLSVTLIPKKK